MKNIKKLLLIALFALIPQSTLPSFSFSPISLSSGFHTIFSNAKQCLNKIGSSLNDFRNTYPNAFMTLAIVGTTVLFCYGINKADQKKKLLYSTPSVADNVRKQQEKKTQKNQEKIELINQLVKYCNRARFNANKFHGNIPLHSVYEFFSVKSDKKNKLIQKIGKKLSSHKIESARRHVNKLAKFLKVAQPF